MSADVPTLIDLFLKRVQIFRLTAAHRRRTADSRQYARNTAEEDAWEARQDRLFEVLVKHRNNIKAATDSLVEVFSGKEPEALHEVLLILNCVTDGLEGNPRLEELWPAAQAKLQAVALRLRRSSKPPRKKRDPGRPPDTDFKKDKRISDAWDSGAYRTEADLARELGIAERQVTLARDRHRKREEREARKRRTNSPDK
jgi:hypothetical protein